jgi:mRNA-degrading endonuclease RelE of RelBE toxin-antitoxin system
MAYSVKFTPQAVEDLARLDKNIAQNIVNKIDWLFKNIESTMPVPLAGKFKGKCKLGVGDCRIVYSFKHTYQVITIYAVRHCSEVYKL